MIEKEETEKERRQGRKGKREKRIEARRQRGGGVGRNPASTKARNTWWVGDDSGNKISADAPYPTPANVVPVRNAPCQRWFVVAVGLAALKDRARRYRPAASTA